MVWPFMKIRGETLVRTKVVMMGFVEEVGLIQT